MTVTTANLLNNISPSHFQSQGSNDACIIFFQDKLYLVYAHYRANTDDEFIAISCYDNDKSNWQELARKSLIKPRDEISKNQDVDIQLNSLTLQIEAFIFPSVNDSQSCLYIQVTSPFGSQLICSENGVDFEVIAVTNPCQDNSIPLSQFLAYQNRLYALPINTGSEEINQWEDRPFIYYCNSPQDLNWESIKAKEFSNDSNNFVTTMAVFNNSLYSAIVNSEEGFQIWKDQNPSPLENSWKSIITKGAYRYSLNQQVSSMTVFQNALYVAAGISKSKNDHFENLYQSGFELIRIYADGDWDLITGTPKFTPEGLKVPLTVMGAGFDNHDNQEVQFLVVHDNFLYLGYQNIDGFQVWRTADGEVWKLVLKNELQNYHHVEIKTAVSTPLGLALLMKVNRKSNLQLWLADV